jgi:hypothetical protein
MPNPYLDLTAEFNRGRLRTLLSSGQAVVMHRLAITSKDGDWIVREDAEATAHVLAVLAARQARSRFGAPLDVRWLAAGWSSHLEHRLGELRLRTDFVSRPPRITGDQLAGMWRQAEKSGDPVIGLEPLAAIKLTNREKDYAVVGQLARSMQDPRAQFLFSRSSRDLIELARNWPKVLAEVTSKRPLLAKIAAGVDALDEALDRERRILMRANEERLAHYTTASAAWATVWPQLSRQLDVMPLLAAHQRLVAEATKVLPVTTGGLAP